MARLRKVSPPEAPALPPPPIKSTRSSPRKTVRESPSKRELRYTSHDEGDSFLVPKAPASETPRRQRVLRPVASNSRLLRKLSDESLASPERTQRRSHNAGGLGFLYSKSLARTVARSGKQIKQIGTSIDMEESTVLDDNEEPDHSLWCGDEEPVSDDKTKSSETDEKDHLDTDEDEPVVNPRHRRRPPLEQHEVEVEPKQPSEINPKATMPPPPPPNVASRPPFRKGHSMISNWAQDVIDLTESPEPPPSFDLPTRMRSASLTGSASRPTTSSSYDASAVLRYSPTPTKQKSPHKAPPIVSRPSTPPLPPVSPSKLVSPSKMKNRIPHAPDLRPSLDAFWSADVVNDWNQQHSPSKPLMSPRKQKWLKAIERKEMGGSGSDSEDSCPSPTTSPRKKNASPSKAQSSPNVAQVRKECKEFRSKTRYAMAESFLKELDTTITGGKISEMSASTGGIKLIWTKTLKTTAGRANWRREQLRLKTGPLPTDLRTEIRHHCSIELAEKVIDTPDRLYNVLAHEYCHLTTFMISDVRTNPHGKAFRTWAARVSTAFTSHNVLVTTKHAYEISFKYVWECVKCGYEFKRHSKSVDPERHSCGRCQSRLVQTKPVPRAGGKGREKSEYQGYMKENFGRVRGELEARGMEAGMGRVVEEVARQYRVMKEGRKEKVEKEVDEVDEVEIVFERLKIGDEGL